MFTKYGKELVNFYLGGLFLCLYTRTRRNLEFFLLRRYQAYEPYNKILDCTIKHRDQVSQNLFGFILEIYHGSYILDMTIGGVIDEKRTTETWCFSISRMCMIGSH